MPIEVKIRLLVADDQEMVRQGVKALIAGTEIKVVAEVASGQAAVKQALETEVDVVLLDVRMPDGDGLTALGRIKLDKPTLPVLLFSAFDNPASIARAIALGGQRLRVEVGHPRWDPAPSAPRPAARMSGVARNSAA